MSLDIKIKDIINSLTEKYSATEWKDILPKHFQTEKFTLLIKTLLLQAKEGTMFTPPMKSWFRSFLLCNPDKVRVVFVNTYPFSKKGIADGLALSCDNSLKPSEMPEAAVTFTASRAIAGTSEDASYDLESLSSQGVIFLNTVVTCPIDSPEAHAPLWFPIMKDVIESLEVATTGVIFVFIGKETESLGATIGTDHYKYFIPYPDKGWEDMDIFTKINETIKINNGFEIIW